MTDSPPAQDGQLRWLRDWWNRGWLPGLLLVLAVFCAYQPVWRAGFIWDDDGHITRPELRSPAGLARIWFHPGATQQYYPLVHSVFWVEHRLWGDSAPGYHLVNILLHALGALLLAKVLRRLALPGAWLAAAIFALHPIQVETVAWISELKNTLSGIFYLGAALAYLEFDRSRQRGKWVLALGLFAAGLMSKTAIATLPAALLVVFWWRRGKISWPQDVWPLIPFFVAGMGAGLFTAWVERKYIIGAEVSEFNYSLLERCLIAGRVFWFYLGKLFWPANLVFNYARWEVSQGVWWQYLFPATALLLLGGLAGLRRRWRGPLAALLFFAGTLFPALGFFNVYPFVYSFVADHFQYLAAIGPMVLAAGVIATVEVHGGKGKRFLAPAVSGGLLLTLAVLTWRQCGAYANVETLWRATLERNPGSFLAHNNLGNIYFQSGRTDEALAQYQMALAIRPRHALTLNNLGSALSRKGRLDEAVDRFNQALTVMPRYAQAHNNLAIALLQKRQAVEAMAHFQTALSIEPNNPEIHNNFGKALLGRGATDEALGHFQKAVAVAPAFAEAQENLAMILSQQGRTEEALAHYQMAVAHDPANPEYQFNLGYAFFLKGEVRKAVTHYGQSLAGRPQDAVTCRNLAWILATCPDPSLRDGRRAVALAEQAVRLSGGTNPTYVGTLAAAYAEVGRFTDAVAMAQRARQQAVAQNNTALADLLQQQISAYQAGAPFRDASQTRAPDQPHVP